MGDLTRYTLCEGVVKIMCVDSIVAEKVARFNDYFRGQAKKYIIPARVDIDDLVQECNILIFDLIKKYPDVDPDSPDFDALVKGTTNNRMLDLVRIHRSKIRDYSREAKNNSTSTEDYFSSLGVLGSHTNPEDTLSSQEEMSGLSSRVENRLRGDALQLWRLLRDDPKSLWDSLQEYNSAERKWPNGEVRKLKAKYKKPTKIVLALYLDKVVLDSTMLFPGDKVLVNSDSESTIRGKEYMVSRVDEDKDEVVITVCGRSVTVAINILKKRWTVKKVGGNLKYIKEATLDAAGLGYIENKLNATLEHDARGNLVIKELPKVDSTRVTEIANLAAIWVDDVYKGLASLCMTEDTLIVEYQDNPTEYIELGYLNRETNSAISVNSESIVWRV